MTNRSFSNPYVHKVKEFPGIVFEKDELNTFVRSITLPIILDIGCGNGEYLTDIASKFPNNFYIGFDLQYKEVYRTALKIKKMGLKNCVVSKMNALEVPDLFNKDELVGALILFPDPWPKTQQKKNRLINIAYVQKLASKMKKGSFLKIRTDNDDYFLHMLKVLYDDKIQELLKTEELSRDYYKAITTKVEYITPFERIFLRDGSLINYILLKRL